MSLAPSGGNPANNSPFAGLLTNDFFNQFENAINTLLADCTGCTIPCEVIVSNPGSMPCEACASSSGVWTPVWNPNAICPVCLGKKVIEQENVTEVIHLAVTYDARQFTMLKNIGVTNKNIETFCRIEYAPLLLTADYIRPNSCAPCDMRGGTDQYKRITGIEPCGLGGPSGTPFILIGWEKIN